MDPQIITFSTDSTGQVTRLEDSNTFLVNSNNLEWGVNTYPPVIFVFGIKPGKTKFDFYKNNKNKDEKIMHCEYRSAHGEEFKLIVHTLN